MSLQIWKSYTDDIDIVVVHPDGTRIGPLQSVLGTVRFRVRGTELLFYYGMRRLTARPRKFIWI